MGQGAHHSLGGHEDRAKENVRQIAHGRPGQAALDLPLLHCPAAAVDNGEHGQCHGCILHPGSGQEFHAKAVVGQTNDGKGTGIDHRHCVQQGRNRRRGHTCLGKPGAQGENGGFHAKAHEGKEVDPQQQISMAQDPDGAKHASQGELTGIAIDDDENHAHQRKGRSTDGIIQIPADSQNSLPGQGVHHQGNCHQGQQLVEKVHGQDIRCKGNTQGNAIGDGIEQKEVFLMGFLLHVFKGIQGCQRPENRHQPGKYHGHTIYLNGDGKIVEKMHHMKDFRRASQQKASNDG